MKILLLVLDAFPATRAKTIDSDGLAHCCLRINEEISRHLSAVVDTPETARKTFPQHHSFDVNVAFVLDRLQKHILETLNIQQRDVFVSVYQVPNFHTDNSNGNVLQYQIHAPQNRDVITNKTIEVTSDRFSQYECVKCLKSANTTQLLLDCTNYFPSTPKRLKHVKHYVGMKVLVGESVAGFMNIEFHNAVCFNTDDELIDYVERQLLPFKYLIDYQFTKRRFYWTLQNGILRER